MRSLPHPHRDPPHEAAAIGGIRRDRAVAEEQLGPAHPLVAQLASLQTSAEQMWVVAAVAMIGSAMLLGERRSPLALLVGAGAAEVILLARWLIRRADVRELCLDLIIESRGDVHVRMLERERRRLLEQRHRATLARSIIHLVEAAQRLPSQPHAHPVFRAPVVRSVAPELYAVADRLVGGAPAVEGVALMEKLLRNGISPLYGSEDEPLRREIGRVRFLLDLPEGRPRTVPTEPTCRE